MPTTVGGGGGGRAPGPRMLPPADRAENCTSYTRDWRAAQSWIPRATVEGEGEGEGEGDGAVLSMVSCGLGMAIMPGLSLYGAPDGIEITALGPDRPTRSIGCLTTPEQARSLAVRVLTREPRAASGIAAVSDSRKSD
ncbi:hypothetical protein ACFWGE_20930 [Streptomyces bacillaris]|uniref:hypothetical protein n=1 Tax=Streptomyces bacillaris TaxID=68179 RepID=UPI003644D61A